MGRFFLTLLLFLWAPVGAQAHFFIEPGGGLEIGQYKDLLVMPNLSPISNNYMTNGYTFGGSAGYRYNLLFAGGQFEKCLSGRETDISAFLGYNIMIRIKLWGSYIFSAKNDISKGTGFKVGLGGALYRLFSLNLEYGKRTFNKYNGPINVPGMVYSGTTETVKFTITFPSPRPL